MNSSPQSYLKDATQDKHIASVIIDAYKSEKFPHSWIISGPEGIGKAELARLAAHYILTYPVPHNAPDNFADNADDDPLYGQLLSGAHPDFLTLKRTLNTKTGKLKQDISVVEARSVAKFFSRRATGEGWRICLIDTADDLNRAAANALLKIVEEPPEKSLIIFICHSAGRLLPTLRSRCRILKCAPLSNSDIINSLGSTDIPHPDIELISALSEGSISKASALGDGGLEIYREMLACLETLPHAEWNALNKFSASLTGAANKEKYSLFADLFMGLMHRIITNTAKGDWHIALQREKALAEKWQIARKTHSFSNLATSLEALLQDKDEYNLDAYLTISQLFQKLSMEAKV